jgi:putative heme-binding domain-containing protein
LFASRASWAKAFFHEVEETKTIHKDDVPYYLARRFKLLKDPAIDAKIDRLWPEVRPLSAAEKSERRDKYSSLLKTGNGDVAKGRMLYLTTCGACHRLFDEGGTLGPELTGYDRSNPQYLLLQIVDPNADIREGYESQRVVTKNGRTIEGRINKQSGGSVTIAPAFGGPSTTLSGEKIATMEVEDISLMPERLLDNMTDAEIRDLFSFLMK